MKNWIVFVTAVLSIRALTAQELSETTTETPLRLVLGAEDPRDAERGPYRTLRYYAPARGTLHIFASSGQADPSLFAATTAADASEPLLFSDEDGGGGTTAFLELPVEPDQFVELSVFARGSASRAAVDLHARLAVVAEEDPALLSRVEAALADPGARADELETLLQELLAGEGARNDPTVMALVQRFTELPLKLRTGSLESLAHGALLEYRLRHLPPTHPTRLDGQLLAALSFKSMGDLERARELEEAAVAIREEILAKDDRELLLARLNLAVTLHRQGELERAAQSLEQVLASASQTLASVDDVLVSARLSYGAIQEQRGFVHEAAALFESVVAALSGQPGVDPLTLNLARQNHGAALLALELPERAEPLLAEALANYRALLPVDHPLILRSELHYADALIELGDLAAARVLQERVLLVQRETLPEDHLTLLVTKQNLAGVLFRLDDLAAARSICEEVLAVRERDLPPGHVDLLHTRFQLAQIWVRLGDLERARAGFERILADLAPDAPDARQLSFLTRWSLSWTHALRGELQLAREVLEDAIDSAARRLPEAHPLLLNARLNLAWLQVLQADHEAAALLLGDWFQATERRLLALAATRGARELEAFASQIQSWLGDPLSMLPMTDDPHWSAVLEHELFALLETTRALGAAQRRLARNLKRVEADPELKRLSADSQAADLEVARLSRQGGEELFEAVRRRDALQRKLHTHLASSGQGTGLSTTTFASVRAALDEGYAAIGFWRYQRVTFDPVAQREVPPEAHYLAFVVRPDAELQRVELGAASTIDLAAQRWRTHILQGTARGVAIDPLQEQAGRDDAPSSGVRLRELVFDPLREALDGATTCFVALDDALHTIPLGALPAEDGAGVLEDELRIVRLTSLGQLFENSSKSASPSLLALGGIEYDLEPVRPQTAHPADQGPMAADGLTQRGLPARLLRSRSWSASFPFLIATEAEVASLGRSFRKAHPEAPATVLTDREASREAFERLAPEVSFLHLATHAYFAPRSIPSRLDGAAPGGRGLPAALDAREQARGFAPMLLCGLAFAGANLQDATGRALPYLMTADELAGMDLTRCELAVLSACDTNVGLRRAGQGVASLQSALHAAGARSMLTSLWKVPDAASAELMQRFYRELWIKGRSKIDALYAAKQGLREQEDASGRPLYATRDWAAWVLSGDPR